MTDILLWRRRDDTSHDYCLSRTRTPPAPEYPGVKQPRKKTRALGLAGNPLARAVCVCKAVLGRREVRTHLAFAFSFRVPMCWHGLFSDSLCVCVSHMRSIAPRRWLPIPLALVVKREVGKSTQTRQLLSYIFVSYLKERTNSAFGIGVHFFDAVHACAWLELYKSVS